MECTKGVVTFAGITDSSNIPDDMRLDDMGMDSLQNSEIQQILARQFNIHKTAPEVEAITYGQLKELSG